MKIPEVSPNNRAGCKGTDCKKEGIKILKGELRFGSLVTIMDHQSWSWKHWYVALGYQSHAREAKCRRGCVTPKQIENLLKEIEGNYDYLDGYDEIPTDFQDKVRTALEQGHVSDSDWKGVSVAP
jgi:hypothetical protein